MNKITRWPIPDGLPKRMVIGGEHVEAIRGARFATLDPATGMAFAEVPAGGPEDVANAVLFMCSEESRNITGQELAVDGGWDV